MPLAAPSRVTETWYRNTEIPFLNGVEATANAAAPLASVVTGGATRVAGGALHLFSNPAVNPVSPVDGDLWVGDVA